MNKEEILAMEAGAELDRLIAERVFQRLVKSWETFQGKPIYQMQVPSDYGEVYGHLSCYSTDISPAWQVMERLKMNHPVIVFNSTLQKWEVAFDGGDLIHGETISEAICKAALLAKLGEK